MHISKSISDIVETSYPILKPNIVPTCPTGLYYTGMIRANVAKQDEKSLTNHLVSPPSNISNIPEELEGTDEVFDGDDNNNNEDD